MNPRVWADLGPSLDESPTNPNESCFSLVVPAEDYDALQNLILDLGRACAVGITGDADSGNDVREVGDGMAAIHEALRLGRVAAIEANTLRAECAALRKWIRENGHGIRCDKWIDSARECTCGGAALLAALDAKLGAQLDEGSRRAEEIDRLRAEVAGLRMELHRQTADVAVIGAERDALKVDAKRWRRVRSLSYEISDPDLRGTVCGFLDRFGENVWDEGLCKFSDAALERKP